MSKVLARVSEILIALGLLSLLACADRTRIGKLSAAGSGGSAGAGRAGALSTDDGTCAFEFATCLVAMPLRYWDCARMNAEHCALLAGSAPDGGVQPSAACTLQEADCIMRNPADFELCMAKVDACTL